MGVILQWVFPGPRLVKLDIRQVFVVLTRSTKHDNREIMNYQKNLIKINPSEGYHISLNYFRTAHIYLSIYIIETKTVKK